MKRKEQIRECFRSQVFERDGYKCVFCNVRINLDAHHITDRNQMPNGGYVKENGITLCPEHHLIAEKYHITNGTEFVGGFHPNDLYIAVDSSFECAYNASLLIK